MTQEGSKDSPEKNWWQRVNKQTDGTIKNGQNRQSVGVNSSMYVNQEQEEKNEEEEQIKSQLPTKSEMADMFSRLEQSLKGEMATLHGDLSQILKRVGETEEKLDTQAVEIKELNEQMKRVQME